MCAEDIGLNYYAPKKKDILMMEKHFPLYVYNKSYVFDIEQKMNLTHIFKVSISSYQRMKKLSYESVLHPLY